MNSRFLNSTQGLLKLVSTYSFRIVSHHSRSKTIFCHNKILFNKSCPLLLSYPLPCFLSAWDAFFSFLPDNFTDTSRPVSLPLHLQSFFNKLHSFSWVGTCLSCDSKSLYSWELLTSGLSNLPPILWVLLVKNCVIFSPESLVPRRCSINVCWKMKGLGSRWLQIWDTWWCWDFSLCRPVTHRKRIQKQAWK